MIRIELEDASDMPHKVDAYAIHHPGDVRFIVRRDAGPEQLVAAVSRLGELMSREVIDATVRRGPAAAE